MDNCVKGTKPAMHYKFIIHKLERLTMLTWHAILISTIGYGAQLRQITGDSQIQHINPGKKDYNLNLSHVNMLLNLMVIVLF